MTRGGWERDLDAREWEVVELADDEDPVEFAGPGYVLDGRELGDALDNLADVRASEIGLLAADAADAQDQIATREKYGSLAPAVSDEDHAAVDRWSDYCADKQAGRPWTAADLGLGPIHHDGTDDTRRAVEQANDAVSRCVARSHEIQEATDWDDGRDCDWYEDSASDHDDVMEL